MKKLLAGIFMFSSIFTFSGCEKQQELNYTLDKGVYMIEDKKFEESTEVSDFVKIDVKDKGIIVVELYPDIAPITVENFKKLVSEKYYDNLIFHRVIKDFMIQTGDPTGTGTGGSEETIKGEFSLNGVENNLSHMRGVISMARRGAMPDTEETMNSASSQFFICHADSEFLDGNYAAFGRVIAGMDVVDKIAASKTNSNDKPIRNQTINTIRFVTQK